MDTILFSLLDDMSLRDLERAKASSRRSGDDELLRIIETRLAARTDMAFAGDGARQPAALHA